jgi:hypothetical protein
MSRKKKNNNFDRDYRDICYFINHVKDIDFRVSLIRSLGYRIGGNVVKDKTSQEKSIVIGKRNEYRIQIAPSANGIPLAVCAIVE